VILQSGVDEGILEQVREIERFLKTMSYLLGLNGNIVATAVVLIVSAVIIGLLIAKVWNRLHRDSRALGNLV